MDREKIIALGEFINKSLFDGSAKTNPAFDEGVILFTQQAIALLKEHEEPKEATPRLLTPEKVKTMKAGTPLVVERFIKYNGKVVPMACWAIHTGSLILSFHGTMFPDTVHEIPYVTIVQNREGKGHHNEYYRFWSDMPTKEQMKQEEWKGIEGDGC